MRALAWPKLPLAAVLILPLALAACGGEDPTPQGGVSASEARELEQAADVLDANAADNGVEAQQ